MKDVLQEITRLRLKRGWTEYELSKNANVSQSTISSWYSKGQMPSIPSLDKICKGFGITLSQFFAEGEEPRSLTPDQRDLLDHWSVLTEEQRGLFLSLFKSM